MGGWEKMKETGGGLTDPVLMGLEVVGEDMRSQSGLKN